MITVLEWISRIFAQFRRSELERQTKAEMQSHFEEEVEAGVRRGLTRQEAERAARLRAGSVSGAMESVRDQRGLGFLDGSISDLRHAWAALRRRPGFLLVAGGALAAAVAINTLIFTIVDGVVLQPLPYPHPERLVRVFEASPRNPKWPVSLYNYLEDKRMNRTLDGIALYTRDDLVLMHDNRPERIPSVAITNDFLPVLGIAPLLGRNFVPTELHGKPHVVILSHTLWASRFHSDPAVVGKPIRLNRETWTVVGVLPRGFQHVGGSYRSPLQGDTVGLWTPLFLDIPTNGTRGWHYTNAIARLKPGISPRAAEEDLNRIMDDLAKRFPDNYGHARARVEPLAKEVVGRSDLTVKVIVGTGLLVLLVACINVAGLCVARVLARKRELAIRQALGGGAWRLIRAVVSENLILGWAGGLAGLALAAALFPLLRSILPTDFPRLHEVGFNFAAAAFAFGTALTTSLLAGLVAAFHQIGVDPRDGLSEASRTSSGSRKVVRLRAVLVAAEVALSCILCFAAALLVRSARLLEARDNGFDSTGVLTFQLELPETAYPDIAHKTVFYSELIRRLEAIPRVRAAGLSTNLPWTGYDENSGFEIPGRPARPGESMQARYQAADPGFLPAMHLRLLRGRWIEPGDRAGSTRVIVINEALARRYFDEENPIGRYLKPGDEPHRIIGVVVDVRDHPADAAAEPAFWWPIHQATFPAFNVAVRTDRDPEQLIADVRRAVVSIDPELPVSELQTMDEIADTALAERRFALWLCETFAILAIVLAAIGTYGMLTYLVEQLRREIGIRLALGASRGDVLWMVLSNALVLAIWGICIGLMLAPIAGRGVSTMLYGVGVSDAVALLLAPAVILLISVLAGLAPGWSAARTEPIYALREQ